MINLVQICDPTFYIFFITYVYLIYAGLLISRITGLDRPSHTVCPSVMYGLLTRKRKVLEKSQYCCKRFLGLK